MPIQLQTGLPGHGKTLRTLVVVEDQRKRENRPVFHNGIKDLALSWQEWDPLKWYELPAGAIMVIDEAQRVFPIRGRGQEVPKHVSQLETHRHLGVDIYLVTQDPMLIDSHVRRLVDRHFHVVRKFGTHFATVHEYVNGVRDSVSKSRGDSIKHEWRYPADAFNWYTSAEKHTVKRRIPMRVYVLGAIPLALGAAIWFFVDRTQSRLDNNGSAVTTAGAAGNGTGRPAGAYSGVPAGPLDARAYAANFQPRIPGLPHTAPVYDEATKPVHAPYPAACVEMGSRCGCYSQQGTRLHMTDALCKSIVAGGFFVAWDTNGGQLQQLPAAAGIPSAGAGGYVGPGAAVAVGGTGYGLASSEFRRPAESSQRAK